METMPVERYDRLSRRWSKYMIIDCHTHLNQYDEEPPRPIEARRDELLENMDRHGVDMALVLTSYKVNEYRPSTRQVVEVLREHDNLHCVAGISYLSYREKDLREIADFLSDGLVKGLKLYPGYEPFYPYDKRCQVLYDLALEFDVPVMIHTGDTYSPQAKVRYAHPLAIDDVAVDNPGLKLVLCHLGNPWIRDCMEVIYKNAHAYADVSGLALGHFQERFERYMVQQVHDMILYAGEPKYLLYGTDWPLCDMGSYLKFVRSFEFSAEHFERVLWRNAAELFKLDVAE
ncbi:MAG: amidohydrolase family protein [Phycisphaeraceae bacterium]|nr:amidohydrolase family protein [Phycisphaeraceae bacterium]